MKINIQTIQELDERHGGSRFAVFAEELKAHYGNKSFSPQQFMRLKKISSDLKRSVARSLMTPVQNNYVKNNKTKRPFNLGLTPMEIDGKERLVVVLMQSGMSHIYLFSDDPVGVENFVVNVKEEEQLIKKYWR